MEEKIKKTLLKTTLENSPFDMEVFALKQLEKNTKRGRKNWHKNYPKILYKTSQFIDSQKLAMGANSVGNPAVS